MKKTLKFYFALLAGAVFFVSCNNDDDSGNTPLGAYDNGVLVLNEGNSGASTSSISFLSDSGVVDQDIYAGVNPGLPGLGTYLQSAFFDDLHAYIISGFTNKVTVVNRYTFEHVATIATDMQNPRYGAIVNGKAYITNYADYAIGTDDFLTVIDLTTYATSRIALNNWSEKITEENGKLYIANGYYGSGSSVTVFNPANASSTVIELGFSPNSFEEEDGILYVLGDNDLAKINLSNNQIAASIVLPEAQSGAQNLVVEDNRLYYTSGTSVFSMALNATAAPTTPVLTYESTSMFGAMYAFAVNDNKIYITDAGDFSSNGQLFVYSPTGQLLQTVPTGIAPGEVYFND